MPLDAARARASADRHCNTVNRTECDDFMRGAGAEHSGSRDTSVPIG
jgi:hypothetical protein